LKKTNILIFFQQKKIFFFFKINKFAERKNKLLKMSESEIKQSDDIRLSNVFRHHLVRSLSPQEKTDVKTNNYSFINQPINKENIKKKFIEEESMKTLIVKGKGTIL